MAKAREKKSGEKGRVGKEITGIVFAALAFLFGASLVLYHMGSSHWVGSLGKNVAVVLRVAMGYSAYVFPVIFIVLAYEFAVRDGLKLRLSIPVSLVLFIIACSGLLSLLSGDDKAGGIVGAFATQPVEVYLGPAGTFIVLVAVFLISLRVGTGISLISLAKSVFSATAVVAGKSAGAVSNGVGAIKERRETARDARREENIVKEKTPRRTKPTIVTPAAPKKKKSPEPVQERFEFSSPGGTFKLPQVSFLDQLPERAEGVDKEALLTNSRILEKKLADFDVEGHVVEVRSGPVVTMYEFEPAPGVKVNKIINLSDDLALAMRAESIRILAPIPGKAVVGIEIPNLTKERILLREMLESPAFSKSRSKLSLPFGKDIAGDPFVADLAKMPHLLVAGSTGAGKSVFVNAMILSILFKSTPEDVRFLMIDPKMLELSAYEGIPHLLTPVVTEAKRATVMLRGMVSEMSKRYRLMAEKGAKNIDGYNRILEESSGDEEEKAPNSEGAEGGDGGGGEGGEGEHRKLPYIVIVIDELADLMMASGKDVEESLVRLSQMARAAGIHLILATQRPSVDVLTGLIKTNFPARVSFQVPSRTDSRTILDSMGAETLLGEGDMLFLPPGSTKLRRVHGAFVSEEEIKKVTRFLRKQAKPSYDKKMVEAKVEIAGADEEELGAEFMGRYKETVEMARKMEMISTSYIQRRLRIGYNTAARIMERMESEGVVGPAQGSRPREVLRRQEGG
ncbi:MAG: DNA translocase FtsK 4TM domain-containing protein [Thermodesulfobacteriota bacterium]